jgi:hypothetical protein
LFKPDVGLCQLPEPQVQELFPAAGRGESLASILRNYHLTPQDKIVLGYAIARAYWQFYDSDLMRARWSSETIHFMPAIDDTGGRLPLRAFVSFPFGMPGEPLEDSILDISVPLNHRCPRVFALGVLLLEIGLATPFPTRTFRSQVSQVNFDHKTAKNQLKTLRAEKWLGFSHAKYFVDAAEYCIEGSNFANDAADLRGSAVTTTMDTQKSVEARRKNLFDHVVRPLTWLAETGFQKSSAGTTYIRKVVAQPPAPGLTHLSPTGPANPHGDVAFHSGPTNRPGRWMDQLKAISAQVNDRRRAHAITKPVRVAILDTGLSSAMEYFQDEDDGPQRLSQVVGWKDFVDSSNAAIMVDEFGHGTLMARLVVEAAPFAELLIARVSRNTKELPRCKDNIAQVRHQTQGYEKRSDKQCRPSYGRTNRELMSFPCPLASLGSMWALAMRSTGCHLATGASSCSLAPGTRLTRTSASPRAMQASSRCARRTRMAPFSKGTQGPRARKRWARSETTYRGIYITNLSRRSLAFVGQGHP